ncbi:uncharacterized protein [Typha latifolia]|uniref:uncharacterized protein n=1 Tax=Typha latifolia TaxID=4733 RepID=UPI003C2B84D1
MALFFDLGIPYLERDGGAVSGENKAKKDARLRAAVKVLELGYAGVAYDRPFRGVMADSDRCKMSPFPISSLLKAAPSLASSAAFHRGLLGSPLDVPFRQYSRITIAIDTAAAAASLASSSNPLLRSYDIVAVRPLNQIAFDHACKFSEIDMISIDFSQKLSFRLKHPLVEAAIKRGLHFEITYSHFIADINVRRQMLSDAKLLVDWTRGKNLIISSAASTASEIRGPYDVINLFAVLLGLSIERAKAAISVNCRSLLVKTLRKKHFYKETIRIERILPDEQSDSKRSLLGKWINWDPISSGDGDLPSLDDMTKFSPADVPLSLKAIDFTSMADGKPFLLSHNAKVASSSCNLGLSSVANDIPPAVSHDIRQQDIVDGVSTDLSTTLMPLEQNSVCETVLAPLGDAVSLLEDVKKHGTAAGVSGLETSKEECAMGNDADAMQLDYAEFSDPISASGDDVLLTSDANPSCSMVTENTEPYNVCVEGYKVINQPDCVSDKLEAPKDVTELMECIPGIIVGRTLLNDNGPSFTNIIKDNIHTDQVMASTTEQELNDELLNAHGKMLPKIHAEPTSSGQTEGLISFVDSMQSKDATKGTKEVKGEVNSIENTVSTNKVFTEQEKWVVNSSLTTNGVKHYNVKSGRPVQREDHAPTRILQGVPFELIIGALWTLEWGDACKDSPSSTHIERERERERKDAMFPSSSSPTSSYGDPSFHLPVTVNPTSFDGNGYFPSSLLASSPPPSYSSSLPSYYLQRSSSTQSFSLHHHIPEPINQPPFSSSSSSSCDFLDFNSGPMRRVYSTGDLQGMNGLPASGENCSQEGGAAGSAAAASGRVGRYSAEERKERIEKYRSKRNQRNFHKKITYACRKTLADSRPRVRGRFARNGEPEAEVDAECFSSNSYSNYEQAQGGVVDGGGNGDWWQMKAALTMEEEDECLGYDDELWANLSDVLSVNLLS